MNKFTLKNFFQLVKKLQVVKVFKVAYSVNGM